MLPRSILQYFWPALSDNQSWKSFLLSSFAWPLKTGLTVFHSKCVDPSFRRSYVRVQLGSRAVLSGWCFLCCRWNRYRVVTVDRGSGLSTKRAFMLLTVWLRLSSVDNFYLMNIERLRRKHTWINFSFCQFTLALILKQAYKMTPCKYTVFNVFITERSTNAPEQFITYLTLVGPNVSSLKKEIFWFTIVHIQIDILTF